VRPLLLLLATLPLAIAFPPTPIPFRQLTRAGTRSFPNAAPAVSHDGRRIAFLANADLTGKNPDHGWEIFLFADGKLRQLTDTRDGDSADPVLNLELSGDREGRRFVFSSSADLTGENGDKNHEVFAVSDEGKVRQLTRTEGGRGYCGGNVQPSLDGGGDLAVFASDLDLTGKNPDANCELYSIRTDGGDLRQLTGGTGALGAVNPTLSADGRVIAFASDEDLAGENGDQNVEIFLVDRLVTGGAPRQLTRTAGGFYGFLGSFYPRLSADGRRLVFISGRDLTGANDDQNAEVYTVSTDPGAVPLQITHSLPGASGSTGCLDNYFPAISADGRRIAFTSLVDVGLGAAGFGATDIYVADFDGAHLTRVTSSAHPSDWPALDGAGAHVYFQSFADLSGDNPHHAGELFVAAVSDPIRPAPAPTRPPAWPSAAR
jgi:Tol biopolymer transport system component